MLSKMVNCNICYFLISWISSTVKIITGFGIFKMVKPDVTREIFNKKKFFAIVIFILPEKCDVTSFQTLPPLSYTVTYSPPPSLRA